MRNPSLLLSLAVLLAACGEAIPEVKDPHRIVVDGQPMSASAFLKRYCQGQVMHPSCVAVSRVLVADATRVEMVKGW